jgi:hypothetical protein
MSMSRNNGMPRAAVLSLAVVTLGLLGVVGFAAHREMRRQPADPVLSTGTALRPPPPLTPEEEAFATALWPMHSEVVEPTAVRLTFAGLVYATDDHDPRKLANTLGPVKETFRAALEKARALDVPASMQSVHQLYLTSLSLYVQASAEMLKTVEDHNDGHMVDAQRMSETAAEDLLKAGDVLWPGEHKPN